MTTEHHTTRSSEERAKAAGSKEEHSTESVQKKCGKHLNAKYGNSGENNIQQVQAEVHAEDVESNGGKVVQN